MPSLSRSATRVVRSRLSPSTCSAGSAQPYQSHADACGSTLRLFALADVPDYPDCSSPSSAHFLHAERRHRRRPWKGGRYMYAAGFAVGVPVGGSNNCDTYRTLSTVTAKPVDESGTGGADGGKHHDEESEYYDGKSDNENDGEEDEEEEEPSESVYKILTGRPQADPAENVEAQRKYVFPKTMEGWKTLFRDVWTTYRNTFEGWETEEERIEREREERRAKGLSVEEEQVEDDMEIVYEIEYDEDALRQKQKEITDNFGRNLNIAHSTGQDLLEQAKEKTGIRTKEDLKIWAGEQMKLATTCLSEFMGGYREGRDEEVDRMLNEYFKDLDSSNNEGNAGGADADVPKGLGDTSAKEIYSIKKTSDTADSSGDDVDAPPSEKKSGRRRRKRRV